MLGPVIKPDVVKNAGICAGTEEGIVCLAHEVTGLVARAAQTLENKVQQVVDDIVLAEEPACDAGHSVELHRQVCQRLRLMLVVFDLRLLQLGVVLGAGDGGGRGGTM